MMRWVASVRLIADPDGCWEWIGHLSTEGYGRLNVLGQRVYAHRYSYERFVGPIPPGLEIDHLCRNRKCVNPTHLEPVTHRINGLRGQGSPAQNAQRTNCANGHPLSGDNLTFRSVGSRKSRVCRQCHRDRGRARTRRKKQAAYKEAR